MSEGDGADAPAPPDSGLFGFDTRPEAAALVIVGVPWEPTLSYGRGASETPGRIVRASHQLDLYDAFARRSVGAEVALAPLHKGWAEANAVACAAALLGDRQAVNRASAQLNAELQDEVARLLAAGKKVGVLGGDHSAPFGAIRALAKAHGEIGVLQIDAHHDLRVAFDGYRYSHASIVHNLLEEVPAITQLVAVGVRDYSEAEQRRAAGDERISTFYDHALRAATFRGRAWHDLCLEIVERLPARVHISFDVDGLDPRFCPHTGTPVPGGLDFREAVHLLETLRHSGRQIVGFDLCEVAPGPPGPHEALAEWDLNVAARLLHKLAALSLM